VVGDLDLAGNWLRFVVENSSMASSAMRRLATSPAGGAGGGPLRSIAAARTAAT
jgi:hypothetical protein